LSGPTEAIAAVKKGFRLFTVYRLGQNLDVSSQVLARVVRIAPRTLARRKREGRLDPSESERVLRIGRLLDQATEVLGGPDLARQWLKSPNRALGNKTPLEYADTEPGAKEVENLLGRIEHGVFS
jgi:putative toxin-antitoxin system antitoxin component (TIGR02293 family)